MKTLGIWTLDLSDNNLVVLSKDGFNGLFLPIGYFYNGNQDETVNQMFKKYLKARELGFKYFLIDCGWGLGEFDNNYFYKKIIDKFRECEDVDFYLGEPIESWLETKTLTWEQIYKNEINERYGLTKRGNLIMDATLRNYHSLADWTGLYKNITISSYYNQHKEWRNYFPHVWIYGQLKIGGSLRYKKLSKIADSLNIEKRFLYQGDLNKWNWKEPFTWLNAILNLIGLQKWFENNQRKRFIKSFGE